MKKLLVLPTWIIVVLTIPFLPKEHEWKGKKITLHQWAQNSTQLNIEFSFMFWMAIILIILGIRMLISI